MSSFLTEPSTYRSPAFIGLVVVLCLAVVLLLHHCVLVACCHGGAGRRRWRRQHHHRPRQRQQGEDDQDASAEQPSETSRTHLVEAAAAVVCRYRKGEAWSEATCPVCLADFDDGEPVRVLPECLHYFHGDCIDTWLRGSTSCPMCRAETTPTPTPTPSPGSLHHHLSLDEILVRA